MPYAERNDIGEVVSLHQFPRNDDDEYIEPSDPEVLTFLRASSRVDGQGIQQQDLVQALISTDRDIARVTEDLIALLVEKKVIIFTDLPIAVQSKLLEREKLRGILNGATDGFIDNDFRLI